jgi:hypothetical protein
MSLTETLSRIEQLQTAFQPRPVATPAPAASPAAFAGQLQGALQTQMTAGLAPAGAMAAAAAPPGVAAGTPAGQAIVNLVRGEIGVTEQPPGSNESPRIAQFRQATAGAPGPGPWCAYFVSWAAREAGAPIGDAGQGYGRVDDVWAWGERSGKTIPPNDPSRPPQPGDLIVWDEHIGVVESVGADGSLTTIEGNSSDMVARRRHAAGGDGAIGYVRLG